MSQCSVPRTPYFLYTTRGSAGRAAEYPIWVIAARLPRYCGLSETFSLLFFTSAFDAGVDGAGSAPRQCRCSPKMLLRIFDLSYLTLEQVRALDVSWASASCWSSFFDVERPALEPGAHCQNLSSRCHSLAPFTMTKQPASKDQIPTTIQVENSHEQEIDPEKERALLRKIDVRLVPCVWFMYLLSYVRRPIADDLS